MGCGGGCWPGTASQQQTYVPSFPLDLFLLSIRAAPVSVVLCVLHSIPSITVGILFQFAKMERLPVSGGAPKNGAFVTRQSPFKSSRNSMAPSSSKGPCEDRHRQVPRPYAGTCVSQVPNTLPLPPFRATRTFPLSDMETSFLKHQATKPTSFDLAVQCMQVQKKNRTNSV